MKKIQIICFSIIFTLLPLNIYATGYPVFDVSNWLTAIDELYNQYDQIQHTISQIENQYRMIQQNVERAKSIDWDNISFDGDFDIRNDIKDANKRVNSMLTSIRNIKQAITEPSMSFGGVNYSIQDLVGAGDDGKNIWTATKDIGNSMTDTMKNVVQNFTNGLTEEQKKAIWIKYGISPSNYAMVHLAVETVKEKAGEQLAKATDKAKEAQIEEDSKKRNVILDAALNGTKDSEGNPTTAGMQEANLLLLDDAIDQLLRLGMSIDEISSLIASRYISDLKKEETKNTDVQRAKQQEAIESRTSPSFRAGRI